MFAKESMFVIAHSFECEFHAKCEFTLGENCVGMLHTDGGHSRHQFGENL